MVRTAHAQVKSQNFSLGFITARKTAALADAPPCGCTLAQEQLNTFFSRSIARFSILIYYSHNLRNIFCRGILQHIYWWNCLYGLHHLQGGKILRGDQFNSMTLAIQFPVNKVKDLYIFLHGAKLSERG